MGEHTVKRIPSATGAPMLARIIREGEDGNEGPGALIAFYDTRYDHQPGLGQFASCYRYATLMGTDGWPSRPRPTGRGLTLHGGVEAWTLDGATVDDVLAWVREQIGPPPVTLRVVDDLPF